MAPLCSVRKRLQSTWSLLLGNHCREEGTCGLGFLLLLYNRRERTSPCLFITYSLDSPSSIKPNRCQHSGWFPSYTGYLNERKEETEREVAGTRIEEGHSPRPDHWVRFAKSDKKGVLQARGQADNKFKSLFCNLHTRLHVGNNTDCLKELASHILSLLPSDSSPFCSSQQGADHSNDSAALFKILFHYSVIWEFSLYKWGAVLPRSLVSPLCCHYQFFDDLIAGRSRYAPEVFQARKLLAVVQKLVFFPEVETTPVPNPVLFR